MSEVNQALHRIAKGAGIVFAGTIISMFFGFLSKVIMVRFLSRAEYGVFNLALTILSIALMIVTMGFPYSLPREIAFYIERKPSRIGSLISTALIIVLMTSLTATALLVLGSSHIANVFNEGKLVYAFNVISFALPISALINCFIAISRGFGRVREQVYFQKLLYPLLWFLLIGIGALAKKIDFYYVFIVYLVAQAVTFFALVIDVFKLGLFKLGSINLKLGKELIRFSLPLMLSDIAGFVMTWTDTLMLGYYKTSEVVGLYNSATPIARLIFRLSDSVAFLYTPLVSQFYVRGKINEMKRTYQILTKWIFLLTLPLFSVMFLFPEVTINFLFGAKYVSASQALRILALGFTFYTLLGLNGWSLIVIGESDFVMVSNLVSAVFNVILNAFLIPLYGMNGAAMATAVSYFVATVFRSFWLYKKTKIHPFTWNYVKPLVISFVLLGLIQSLHLRVSNIWNAILALVIFLAVYFFLVLLSKSIDKEDVELLLAIERRLGIDLGMIKKVLKRFV